MIVHQVTLVKMERRKGQPWLEPAMMGRIKTDEWKEQRNKVCEGIEQKCRFFATLVWDYLPKA